MSLLSILERRFKRLAIANLGLYLVVIQGVAFVMDMASPGLVSKLVLDPSRVVAGEWWRVVTFVMIPPITWGLFVVFALYVLYMMSTALEQTWGSFRFNAYLFIGWLATLAVSFGAWGLGFSGVALTNEYLMSSIFLAFAFLYPDFTFYVFFIIPVRVKWLALLTWVLYGFQIVAGDGMERAAILGAVLNFFIFFGGDLWYMVRHRSRRVKVKIQQMQNAPDPDEAFHRCTICGRTDKTNPELEFRYCPQCGGKGYCMDHIVAHQHMR